MPRNHITQLVVMVNVLMLSSVSTHSAGSNFLVHSTEWHLEGSEVFVNIKAGQATFNCKNLSKKLHILSKSRRDSAL